MICHIRNALLMTFSIMYFSKKGCKLTVLGSIFLSLLTKMFVRNSYCYTAYLRTCMFISVLCGPLDGPEWKQ